MSLEREFQLQQEVRELRKQLADIKASPTIEACRQMIEAQAVKENEKLHQQLADMTAERDELRELLKPKEPVIERILK